MTRDEMIVEARALGLRGAHLMKDETLRERIAGGVFRVCVPNVWWNGRRYLRGERIERAPELIQRGQVEAIE